jgi:SAM-dependent methyltransferase
MATVEIDPPTNDEHDDTEAFIGQLFNWINGAGAILLIDVAHKVGLLEAAAAAGPVTSTQLASRAELSERHVRELLNGLSCAGVFTYTPDDGCYTLPPSRQRCLSGTGPQNYAAATGFLALAGRYAERVAETVRHGGGIPYSAYRPQFTELMDAGMRRVYDTLLIDGYVPAVPGLREILDRGARVADLGCGTGHVDNLLATAFPRSTFIGYDLATDALDRARAEAADLGLSNVTFEEQDVLQLPTDPPLDVVFAVDSIHDQASPAGVLTRARTALAPDGRFVMIDTNVSSQPEDNITHPIGAWLYTTSLFHCMQVSLAEHGAGLGTCWGRQTATHMLEQAGFRDVTVITAPAGDPMNAIFTGRR